MKLIDFGQNCRIRGKTREITRDMRFIRLSLETQTLQNDMLSSQYNDFLINSGFSSHTCTVF